MIRAAVARSLGLAVAEASGQKSFPDCSRCSRPENGALRTYWGCDEKSAHPVWTSTCYRCSGSDPECPLCEGQNEVHHHRCPSSILEAATLRTKIELDLLLRAYRHYDQRSVFPSEGAFLDQSRSFCVAVELIDSEKAYWNRIHEQHQRTQLETERRRQSAQQTRRR